ncbi:hypothetical protein QJQ45_024832, partial [Haematococcus lacustris]
PAFTHAHHGKGARCRADAAGVAPGIHVAIQRHVAVTLATWDAVWGEYLHPKWAEQRMRQHGAQEKVLERYFMKVGVPKGRVEGAGQQAEDLPTCDLLGAHVPSSAKDVMRFVCALCAMQLEEEAASVSQQEWGTRKQLVVFFGNAGIGTRGGWGAKAVLQACRKVVERLNSGKPTDRVPGKVVTVDEFRTSRVSSILNSPQPCEEELDRSKPTRLEGWKPKPGQVQDRLLRSAWSKRFEAPVRGLMWCPWLAQATPGKLGKWVDRDCNAALNLQRAGESKWRPLELCRWQHRGRLPAQGKEYPALGFKKLLFRARLTAQHCMHSQPAGMMLDGPGPLNSPVPIIQQADHLTCLAVAASSCPQLTFTPSTHTGITGQGRLGRDAGAHTHIFGGKRSWEKEKQRRNYELKTADVGRGMVDTGCPDLAHSPAASGLRGSEGQGSAYVDEGDAAANLCSLPCSMQAADAARESTQASFQDQVVRGPLAGHAGIPTESQEHGLSTLARGAPSLPALEPHNAAAGQNSEPSFLQGQPVPLPAHLAAAESCAVAAVDLASLLTPGAATGPQHVQVHRSAAMAAAGAAGPARPRSSPSADYPHYTWPEAGGSPAPRATSGQPRTTSPAKAWPSSAAGQVALPFLPGSLLQWSQQAGPALGQAGSSKAVELLPLELAPQTRLPAAPRQQAGSTASFCPVTAAPALQELAALPMPASTALTATAQTGSNLHGVAVAAAAPAASLFANELPGPQQPIPVHEATLQHASSHVGMIDSRQFPTQSLEALDNLAWGQRYAPAPAGSVAVLPGQLGEQPTTHVQTGSTRHEHHWEQPQHPDPLAPGPAPYLAGTTGVCLPAGSVHTSGQAAPAPSLSGAEALHSQHVLLWHASVHASNLGPQVSAASLTGQEEEGGDNGGVGESQAVAAGEAVAGFSPQVPPAASAQASPCRPDAQHSQGAWQLQDAVSHGPGWREAQPEWLPAAHDHQQHHHHHHHQGPVLSCEAQLGQGMDSGLPGSPLRSEAAAEWPDTAEHASRQAAATSAPGPSLAHLGSGHHHHHHRQPCGPAAQHCMHSQPVRMVLDGPGPLNSPVPILQQADHSSLPGSRSLAAPTAHPHAFHAHRHHRPVVSGARAAASRAQPASGGLADRGSVLSGMAANGCDSAGRGLLALAEAESTPRSRGQHPATAGSGMTAAAGPVPAKSPSHGPGHMVGPPGSQQQQGMDILPKHGGRGRARKRDVQVGRGHSGPSAVSSDPVALRGDAGALGGAGAGEGAPMGLLGSAGPEQATHACKPSSGGSVDAMDMEGASSDSRTSGAGCQPSQVNLAGRPPAAGCQLAWHVQCAVPLLPMPVIEAGSSLCHCVTLGGGLAWQVGLAAPQLADSQLAHKPSESGRSSQASEDGEVENSCRGPQRQQSVQWAAQSAAGQRPGRLEQRPGASGTAMPGMLGSPELHGSHRHELGIPTPSGTAQASCPMHDSMAHSRRLAEPQCSGEGQGRGYSPADRTAFRLASQWLPGHGVAAVGAAGTARLDAGIAAAARGLGNSSQAVGKPSFTVPAHQLPPAKPVPQRANSTADDR